MPRHKAPAKHRSGTQGAVAKKVMLPTFVAMTAAGLGVTGIVGGAQLLGGAASGTGTNNTSLPDVGRSSAGPSTQKAKPDRAGGKHAADGDWSDPSASSDARQAGHASTEDELRAHEEKQATVVTKPKPEDSLAAGKQTLDRTAVEALREEREVRAARAAREEAEDSGDPKEIARALAAERGWSGEEFSCLEQMWSNESDWDTSAENPSTGAYGIPQALPGSKMAESGPDWQTNAKTQIKWGLDYIATRYDTPCGAWSFWQNNNWY